MQKDGEIAEELTHKLQTGWMKWRSIYGNLWNPHITLKLKGILHKMAIWPAILYGMEFVWSTLAHAQNESSGHKSSSLDRVQAREKRQDQNESEKTINS